MVLREPHSPGGQCQDLPAAQPSGFTHGCRYGVAGRYPCRRPGNGTERTSAVSSHHRPQRTDAEDLYFDKIPGQCADDRSCYRRKRDRQGTGRRSPASGRGPQPQAPGEGQLLGLARKPVGKRTVRPCKRCVYRGDPGQYRTFSPRRWRHHLLR